MDCPITAASVNIPRSPSFLLTLKSEISNEHLIDLLEVVANCLSRDIWVVMGSAWYPGLLLGHRLDHTSFCILCESKLNLLQVVFAGETTFIERLIVVGSELCRVCPLDRIDKVPLARVFIKGIGFGLV